jgi:hypothetical protein
MSEIIRLRAEIDALRNSTSWRVTAPLRAISQIARNALRSRQSVSIAQTSSVDNNANKCRLCDGTTLLKFRRIVLLKYDVGYHKCLKCGSIQTDGPFWLDEAYSIPGVHIDVGIASRTVRTWILPPHFSITLATRRMLRVWILARPLGFLLG